jgi:hypothetical protein
VSPLYRHYFDAPLTGSFVSNHEDFEAAVQEVLSTGRNVPLDVRFFCLALKADVDYTLNNITPVDMPGNPEISE